MISSDIIQTLKYSDHFGFPLTLDEIHQRLISSKSCSLERVSRALGLMSAKHQIQQTGNFYYLPGHSSLVTRRLARAKTSLPQLARAKTISSRLSHLPGVLAIYLTGSLAMSNSGSHADIDFMIITYPNRLWTTRILLTLYTELLGLRRRPHSNNSSGKICLNLYLTPDTYELPLNKRSLYTAYELIQAIPLYDPHDTRSALFSANSWIKNYLPNFPLSAPTGSDPEGSAQPRQYRLRGGSDPIGTLIESICYHLQLAYMRGKLTREYITRDSAFFHPNDPGSKVLSKLRV